MKKIKDGNVYDFEDFTTIVKKSNNSKMEVLEMKNEDFYDIKMWAVTKKNCQQRKGQSSLTLLKLSLNEGAKVYCIKLTIVLQQMQHLIF